MFKRFVKAVKDVAKRVWEFIKKLLPKKPKPKEETVESDEEGKNQPNLRKLGLLKLSLQ